MELLHHILVHRSNKSLMAGDTATFFQDIEISIYPDPFFLSCQIYPMNKKAGSKDSLKSMSPFK